jgi:hypothetical protein
LLVEGFVVIPNTVLQGLNKTLVIDMVKMRLEILQFDIEEQIGLSRPQAMCQEVVNSQPALSPRGHENNNGLCRRVLLDGKVGGFGHGDHKRREVVDGKRLDMDSHVEWSSAEERKYNK